MGLPEKLCCITNACPKHHEAVLSNLLYSHLPLRYISADEEHCSSTPATLAAPGAVMRYHPSISLEHDETHALASRQAPHHLILDALGGRPGVGE